MTRTTTRSHSHSSDANNNPRKRRRLLTFGSDNDESDSSSPPPPAKRPSVIYAASKPELQQYHAKLTTVGSSGPRAGHNATREVVQKEIDILKGLDHLNINKITDVFYEHAQHNIHIFLELCTGGDLLQFIEERVQVGDGESKYIGLQLMKALNYLHSRKISHRDLKPENVLVHAPGAYPRIMLADFGFAKDNSFERTRSLAGTVSYVPPEALSVLFGYGMGSQAPSFDARRGGKHPFDYGYDSAENSYASERYSTPVADTPEKRSYWNSPWASFEIDFPSPQRPDERYLSASADHSHSPSAEIPQDRTRMNYGGSFSNDVTKSRTLEREATLKPAKPTNHESRWEEYSYAESYEDSMRSTVSEHMIKKRIMSGPVKFDWMGWGSRPEAERLFSKLLDPNPKTRLTIAGALRSAWVVEDLPALRKMYEKRIGPF
ncbi:Meiosis-specific serine/threonine-protein kinase mek1 [Tulasnella sp. 417]|nr:Meiosis-specific serine/threonine-protein kinase mek1 [Tulasnella sp. 417]